jgi:hypothetical protein
VVETLLTVVLVLVILGVALYCVERFIPMAEPFKIAIRAVVVIGFLLWLLQLARIGAFRV